MEASGLLLRWVYSLFLVTLPKKLPSTGALWHAAAWKKRCLGQILLCTFSHVSLIVSLQIKWSCCSCYQFCHIEDDKLCSFLIDKFCKMKHNVRFCRYTWVGKWQLSYLRSTNRKAVMANFTSNLLAGWMWEGGISEVSSYDRILVLFSPLLLSGFGSTWQL